MMRMIAKAAIMFSRFVKSKYIAFSAAAIIRSCGETLWLSGGYKNCDVKGGAGTVQNCSIGA